MKKFLIIFSVFGIGTLNAQNRIVLLEQFTNSSCPSCAGPSPLIYNFADGNPLKTAVVAYHTSFPYPNDSMNIENATESAARVSYYSISGTPTVVMDGNAYQGSAGTFASSIGTRIDNRRMVAERYTIVKQSLVRIGNQLTGQIIFTSSAAANLGENLKIQAVVVEQNVLKSSYLASPGNNSETEYGYVMRKMIPSPAGTAITNTTNGESDTLNFSINLLHIKNYSELRLVAFVQNSSTKEVYNAMMFSPTVAFLDLKENAGNEFAVYPNPSTGKFTIASSVANAKVELFDIAGNLVYVKTIENEIGEIDSKLTSGMYILKITSASFVKSTRIQIGE
jgi:Outer membrane protein Omp28/Secretion system C-terminal sorting domain